MAINIKTMLIDVDQVLKEAQKGKQDPEDPEVIQAGQVEYIEAGRIRAPSIPDPDPPAIRGPGQPEERSRPIKGDLLADLAMEMKNLRIARARLSNKYPEMVRSGASAADLISNYREIESYTEQMKEVYSRRRHVERFGRLPDPEPRQVDPVESNDLIRLKKYRRSLNDKKCKLKRKLQPNAKTPKNPSRITEWALELDQVEAEQKRVNEKINQIKDKYE